MDAGSCMNHPKLSFPKYIFRSSAFWVIWWKTKAESETPHKTPALEHYRIRYWCYILTFRFIVHYIVVICCLKPELEICQIGVIFKVRDIVTRFGKFNPSESEINSLHGRYIFGWLSGDALYLVYKFNTRDYYYISIIFQIIQVVECVKLLHSKLCSCFCVSCATKFMYKSYKPHSILRQQVTMIIVP